MFEKMKYLAIIWLCVTFAYIFIAYTNDVWDTMADLATTEMASQNLSSEIVGIEEALGSSNYWKWLLPGAIGIVLSAVTLREEITHRVSGNG